MAYIDRLQHLALDEEGQLIDIRNVTDRSKKFYCPYCKQEMGTRMGEKNRWSFYHLQKKDDYDNYLHTIAENIICGCFNLSDYLPIIFGKPYKCEKFDNCPFKNNNYCTKTELSDKENLKTWIDKCEMEQTFGEFRADILCHNSKNEKNPIFIEIYVTHQCEPKKIESGIKIIEFKIESEEDIYRVINNPIQENEYTKFYNFKPKVNLLPQKEFAMPMRRFTLFRSGKAFLDDISCKDFNRRRGIFELTIDVDLEEEDFPLQINDRFWSQRAVMFPLGLIVARRYFPNVRNCQICRWQYTTISMERICKLFKKCHTHRYCSENDPLTCQYFQIDFNVQKQMEDLYTKFSEKHHIDIWKASDAVLP